MKKLGKDSIQTILKRACNEFLKDDSASEFVTFFYKNHSVCANFSWSTSRSCWYVSRFNVVYSRCIMQYFVLNDYDMDSALCR